MHPRCQHPWSCPRAVLKLNPHTLSRYAEFSYIAFISFFCFLFFFLPFLFRIFFIFNFFCLLGPHLQHMEIPRLGVKSKLPLLAYTTATATQGPSCVCDLHHSPWQCQILTPLCEARDQTCNLMVTSQVHKPLSHNGNAPQFLIILYFWVPKIRAQQKLKSGCAETKM